ncbi:transposase, Ptta/En/Spm, plant [Spatholobus suberectus]|nr:transposase, Ptta/En/Spm, plant [Spatholobus suberectus]
MSNARRGHHMEPKLGTPMCRNDVILSTLLKKDGNYMSEEEKVMVDKISETLSKDQEHATTLDVP